MKRTPPPLSFLALSPLAARPLPTDHLRPIAIFHLRPQNRIGVATNFHFWRGHTRLDDKEAAVPEEALISHLERCSSLTGEINRSDGSRHCFYEVSHAETDQDETLPRTGEPVKAEAMREGADHGVQKAPAVWAVSYESSAPRQSGVYASPDYKQDSEIRPWLEHQMNRSDEVCMTPQTRSDAVASVLAAIVLRVAKNQQVEPHPEPHQDGASEADVRAQNP